MRLDFDIRCDEFMNTEDEDESNRIADREMKLFERDL